ncbi:MAG: phosphonate ABC transporter, permease protein PhnE [Acidimicrobiaceae bacterium TMED244]|nr:MAG: phosphonate ABC transporter, permease protein PhnE [Acidimicrobiaceae bacterium TMED244]|tara:strand:+ start:2710 stop:3534 length:825 start_codon:yes stop_codon:yes gene_type:complete
MAKKKDFMSLPKQPIQQRILKYTITALIVIGSIWSASGLEITLEKILKAPEQIAILVGAMFPLDLSAEAIERILPKVAESLFIAWAGTVIGALFSFPIAFLAANNVAVNYISETTKQILNGIRAFPELILAFVFLPITGLGALTGTLAIGIHSIGTLGKLSSEVIEGIDEGPLEAIKSSGGSKINELLFGVVPQVMPTITSYWLYRFEINLRASAVLGVVGAGGVGAELINQLRFRDFPRAGTVLVATVVLVLTVDTISAAIRRRIIKGRSVKV